MVDVVVFGKHVEITAPLRELTLEKLTRLDRFANDLRRIEVEFSEIKNRRVAAAQTCEILVHLTGHLVKGQAAAGDHQSALDLALEKVAHQMRRLHDRRITRRASRRDGGPGRASTNGADAPEATAALGEGDGEPSIVKTKQFAVKPMDPQEAALQMELLGHDFFLFTSAENGRAAVIYRRRDGHLGLIEASG
jgi:putative sigma-54 modulation protein